MNDLTVINVLDAPKVKQVLSDMIDGLIGLTGPDYKEHKASLSLDQWWNLSDSWQNFCKECVRNNYEKGEIVSKLDNAGVRDKEQVMEVIWVKREEIRRSLVTSTSYISKTVLTDFDWQLKLIMSSDKLSNVHEPVVSVDFMLQNCDGTNQNTTVELSREQLQSFMSSLEAASKFLRIDCSRNSTFTRLLQAVSQLKT